MICLNGDGVGATIRLHLPWPKTPFTISWFERVHTSIASPLDLDVTISGTELSSSEERIPMLTTTTSSVTSLYFTNSRREADRWIKYLATPIISNGVAKWPMPKLHTLTFDDGTVTTQCLMEMIMNRYGGGRERQYNGSSERSEDVSSRLREFGSRPRNEGMVEEPMITRPVKVGDNE